MPVENQLMGWIVCKLLNPVPFPEQMCADKAFMPEKIVFGDIKSSSLGNGDGIVQISGTFETLLQPFIVFELGQEGFQ